MKISVFFFTQESHYTMSLNANNEERQEGVSLQVAQQYIPLVNVC